MQTLFLMGLYVAYLVWKNSKPDSDYQKRKRKRVESEKKCVNCMETISVEAKVCKYCHRDT